MDNSPEELEAQKARAFRPPEVNMADDIKLIISFGLFSVLGFGLFYYVLGFLYITIFGGGWKDMQVFILTVSFAATVIFAVFRTLRFAMAQTASDAYMVFPMSTGNVRGHLRDLVKTATALEWDLFGLIGSLAVVILTFLL